MGDSTTGEVKKSTVEGDTLTFLIHDEIVPAGDIVVEESCYSCSPLRIRQAGAETRNLVHQPVRQEVYVFIVA